VEDFDKEDFENAWRLSGEEYLLLDTDNHETGLLLSGKEIRRGLRRYRRWRRGNFKAEVVFRSQIRDMTKLLKRWANRVRV
jgi:hypothetical protein